MPGGRGECGARGRSLISLAPGRSGHHACRHYDRHAGCVAGSGQARRRSDPRPLDGFAHEAWPGSHQGTTHPLGRAEVERRQASAPESGKGGASRFLRGATAPVWCGTDDSAFAGVPLPLLFFVIASEAKQSSPAATFWIASSLRSIGKFHCGPVRAKAGQKSIKQSVSIRLPRYHFGTLRD